jgi:hypothetical protein
LNNIQEHFVYRVTCENNNKVYIGQSMDPYQRFKQHMHRPPKKMKHDIEMNKTVNLTFKLDILYSNMHKYKVVEWKPITFKIWIVPLVQAIIILKENLRHTKSIGI